MHIKLGKMQQRSAEFLAINPLGKVPALQVSLRFHVTCGASPARLGWEMEDRCASQAAPRELNCVYS